MMLQLAHAETDETLVIVGISDWEQSRDEDTKSVTVFFAPDIVADAVPDELTLAPEWELEASSDSEWFTDAMGEPNQYLEETIELNAAEDNTTVWVVPSETFPVLTLDEWAAHVPDADDVGAVTA